MTHFSSSSDFTFETLNKLKKDPTVNVKTVSANDMLKEKVYNTLDFSPNNTNKDEESPNPKANSFIQETASNIASSQQKLSVSPKKNDDIDSKRVSGFSIARTEASTE